MEKNAKEKVSSAGFSAVFIIHRSGKKTNTPIKTNDVKKNIRKPIVFWKIIFSSYTLSGASESNSQNY